MRSPRAAGGSAQPRSTPWARRRPGRGADPRHAVSARAHPKGTLDADPSVDRRRDGRATPAAHGRHAFRALRRGLLAVLHRERRATSAVEPDHRGSRVRTRTLPPRPRRALSRRRAVRLRRDPGHGGPRPNARVHGREADRGPARRDDGGPTPRRGQRESGQHVLGAARHRRAAPRARGDSPRAETRRDLPPQRLDPPAPRRLPRVAPRRERRRGGRGGMSAPRLPPLPRPQQVHIRRLAVATRPGRLRRPSPQAHAHRPRDLRRRCRGQPLTAAQAVSGGVTRDGNRRQTPQARKALVAVTRPGVPPKRYATSTASRISASEAPAARARLAMVATPSAWASSASTIMVMRCLYLAGIAPADRIV